MKNNFFECRAIGNEIQVHGVLKLENLDTIFARLYHITKIARYSDVIINLSNLTSIYPSIMPPLACRLCYLRQEYNIDFELIEPKTSNVKDRIRNYGLAYNIDPNYYNKPRTNSAEPTLLKFNNHDEQEEAVDNVVRSILRKTKINRTSLSAVEWAINEITDNVLTHSSSKVGGQLIYSLVPETNIIEFAVADSGIGISKSLGINNEVDAVEQAVQEGVTKNKSTNQGNGLYGTYRLALGSNGIFQLKSRHGLIFVKRDGTVKVTSESIPYSGTYLVCQIDCDRPDLISRALSFNNKAHTPAYDYLEKMHEQRTDEQISISARDICKTFGSRKSGIEAKTYIQNMLENYQGKKLLIDFDGVNIISSSYADEVFGKLFVELGPMRFIRFIEIVNGCSEIEGLIDRAISKRTETGL